MSDHPVLLQSRELTHSVIGAAMSVHSALGPRFLESVYRNALAWEIRRRGTGVELGQRIQVRYSGVPVGDFVADLLVESALIVEVKAVKTLATAHEVQLVNYLTATGIEIGLLLNFGAPRLQFRRKLRSLS